jgi:hypothetical protein
MEFVAANARTPLQEVDLIEDLRTPQKAQKL